MTAYTIAPDGCGDTLSQMLDCVKDKAGRHDDPFNLNCNTQLDAVNKVCCCSCEAGVHGAGV